MPDGTGSAPGARPPGGARGSEPEPGEAPPGFGHVVAEAVGPPTEIGEQCANGDTPAHAMQCAGHRYINVSNDERQELMQQADDTIADKELRRILQTVPGLTKKYGPEVIDVIVASLSFADINTL